MPQWLNELAQWCAAQPPEWLLLLLLPFAVGAAGLLADRRGGKAPAPRPPGAPAPT